VATVADWISAAFVSDGFVLQATVTVAAIRAKLPKTMEDFDFRIFEYTVPSSLQAKVPARQGYSRAETAHRSVTEGVDQPATKLLTFRILKLDEDRRRSEEKRVETGAQRY